MMPRRTFLRQLATLPLVGGAVTILGAPTASAVPVTHGLLENYKTWLDTELRFLAWEMAHIPAIAARYARASELDDIALHQCISRTILGCNDAARFVHYGDGCNPSTRAAAVLSAAGCGWRSRVDHPIVALSPAEAALKGSAR